jgi:hypothetical protein
MAYLPSRWDSGDEANGPHMDEITNVTTAAHGRCSPSASAAICTPSHKARHGKPASRAPIRRASMIGLPPSFCAARCLAWVVRG